MSYINWLKPHMHYAQAQTLWSHIEVIRSQCINTFCSVTINDTLKEMSNLVRRNMNIPILPTTCTEAANLILHSTAAVLKQNPTQNSTVKWKRVITDIISFLNYDIILRRFHWSRHATWRACSVQYQVILHTMEPWYWTLKPSLI